MANRKIQSALISVYHKDNLEPIVKRLNDLGVKIYSTGGTEKFIQDLGIPVIPVESITEYPSIFGGRVKTLHPKVFGGILHRRDNDSDREEMKKYNIPPIDLVIVDLYPFEETVAKGGSEEEIIEKIDIGGIALIRGAAKNFKDVMIVSSRKYYDDLQSILDEKNGETSLTDRKLFAARAFEISSHYDSAIFNHVNSDQSVDAFKLSSSPARTLRYGENPHQNGYFYGDLSAYFDQVHGKEISYNNLVDIEAAVQLIAEFEDTAFAILKHNNACGIATGKTVSEAYHRAFAADSVSAFGGVLVTNAEVDEEAAEEMHDLFFEILIAPSFSKASLEILKQKKNRILLIQKKNWRENLQYKSLLGGTIVQDYDLSSENESNLEIKTRKVPTKEEIEDLIFAAKVCKQSKSNTIVLAKKRTASWQVVLGQTSRVDALKQAIAKAGNFGLDLRGAVMASDAFFPFPDCVEIAGKAGITAIVQPGGSVKDQLSIDYCDEHKLAMVFTGVRHFKH